MAKKDDYGRFEFIGDIPQQYGNAIVALSQACQGYVEGAARINEEFTSFVRRRLDQDIGLGRALSHCESLQDAAALQQDWVRTAAEDYMKGTTKLYEICIDSASNGWRNGAEAAESATRPKKGDSQRD